MLRVPYSLHGQSYYEYTRNYTPFNLYDMAQKGNYAS